MARKKGPSEALISGLLFTVAFSIVWIVHGGWFWVFPLMFAGVLPLVEGLRRVFALRRVPKINAEQADAMAEKLVLKVAKEEGGRVTPALIALKSNLNTKRAEEVLQNLVKNGFAGMEVTDDGRIIFDFPEFRRPLEDSR